MAAGRVRDSADAEHAAVATWTSRTIATKRWSTVGSQIPFELNGVLAVRTGNTRRVSAVGTAVHVVDVGATLVRPCVETCLDGGHAAALRPRFGVLIDKRHSSWEDVPTAALTCAVPRKAWTDLAV